MVHRRGVCLERLPADFRWRFSWHPALWRLGALRALLEAFCSRYPEDERSPWLFERQAVALSSGILDGPTLRVGGATMTIDPRRRFRHLVRVAWLRLGRKLGSEQASVRCDDAAQYYEGPYPLYWSGLVSGGRQNAGLFRYLNSTGRELLAAEMRRALPDAFAIEQ